MEKYDVVIIGGGVVGCATARELSRFALNTVLLEAGEDICSGQSKANTAIVHGGYDAMPGTLKAKYNVLGNRMFPNICRELDVHYENNGSLVAVFDEKDIGALNMLMMKGRANGVEGLEVLNEAELRKKEPNIGSRARAALWVPGGGICCPYELTWAYAENAADNGVRFITDCRVTDISRENGGYRISADGGYEFHAECVLNCAGVHSAELNNLVSAVKYTVTPRKGEYYIVDKSFHGKFKSTIFQLPTAMGKGVLVAPTVDGTLLIGPTAQDIDDPDDKSTTAAGLADVLEKARLTWENIPAKGFITTFAGVRAHAGDDFVIGEAPDAAGFFNALGIESPGLSAAPAIGRELARLTAEYLGAKTNCRFNPFRKGIIRFAEMTDEEREAAALKDPNYRNIICRCEQVTEAEIIRAIHSPIGARSIDGVKRRTRAGMGRCQGGFCMTGVMEILSRELDIPIEKVMKCGGGSYLTDGSIFDMERQ